MLPINESVRINGIKYRIQSTENGYMINDEFIIYRNDSGNWCGDIDSQLLNALGKYIEDLVWFNAMGI